MTQGSLRAASTPQPSGCGDQWDGGEKTEKEGSGMVWLRCQLPETNQSPPGREKGISLTLHPRSTGWPLWVTRGPWNIDGAFRGSHRPLLSDPGDLRERSPRPSIS